MAYKEIEQNSIPQNVSDALMEINKYLKLKSCSITLGGPSIADPCGMIYLCVGFRSEKNSCYFALNNNGEIVQFGGRFGNKDYRIPYVNPITS